MAHSKEVKKSEERFRNWVFTLNNYTHDDIDRLANPYEQVKYIAYGKEIAPNSGTPCKAMMFQHEQSDK